MAANSETVEIIIEGTNNSASAFKSAIGNTTQLNTQTRLASNLIANLASQLGLPSVAHFAQEISGATGQIKNMAEGARKGSIGVTMLQASIAAVTVGAAFRLGGVIAGWVYQTKKAREEFAAFAAEMNKQADTMLGKRSQQFSFDKQLIDLEDDVIKKRAMQLELLGSVTEELNQQSTKQREAQAALDEWNKSWAKSVGGIIDFSAGTENNQKALEETLSIENKRLAALRQQSEELKAQVSPRQAAIDQLKEEKRLAAEHAKEREQNQKRYLESFAALAIAQDELMEKQNDADWGYIDDLRLTLVELREGKDAADDMAAAMRGIGIEAREAGKELREQIKIERDKQEWQREEYRRQQAGTPALAAKESRFLTRGTSGGSDSAKVAKNTEELKKLAAAQLDQAKRQTRAAESEKTRLYFAEVQ